MSNGGDCRTAPATPGLLTIYPNECKLMKLLWDHLVISLVGKIHVFTTSHSTLMYMFNQSCSFKYTFEFRI